MWNRISFVRWLRVRLYGGGGFFRGWEGMFGFYIECNGKFIEVGESEGNWYLLSIFYSVR